MSVISFAIALFTEANVQGTPTAEASNGEVFWREKLVQPLLTIDLADIDSILEKIGTFSGINDLTGRFSSRK